MVVRADNGRELVEQCRAQDVDLIITDVHMTEIDGIEATRHICSERPIPVIVVSSIRRTEQVHGATDGHVTLFLVKPVNLDDLESAILSATGVRRAEFGDRRPI